MYMTTPKEMHKYSTNLGLYIKYPSFLVLGPKFPNLSKDHSFLAYVGRPPSISTYLVLHTKTQP